MRGVAQGEQCLEVGKQGHPLWDANGPIKQTPFRIKFQENILFDGRGAEGKDGGWREGGAFLK